MRPQHPMGRFVGLATDHGAGVTSQSGWSSRQINGLFKVDVAPAVNSVSSRVGGVCYVGLFDMYIDRLNSCN